MNARGDLHANSVEVWETVDHDAILFDVEFLPDSIQKRVRRIAPHYRAGVSDVAGRSHWLNHCTACGAAQADFDLFCEPEGAFVPISPAAATRIRLVRVPEPFEARANGYGHAPEYLEYARAD